MQQSNVKDVSDAEFQAAVLERSKSVPVVVDFWAGWCAPCRMLGPTLEKEVEALGGKVELAKVDVDANQAIAGQLGVQGIPAVKAFRDGKLVAEFVGARDARFVRQWLAGLAPSEAAQAVERARTLVAGGRAADAEALLRAALDDAQVGADAALELAALALARGDEAEAGQLLDRVPAHAPQAARAEALRRTMGFARDASAYGGEAKARAAVAANPDDLEARWALASALAARGELAPALEQLLEVVSRSRKYRDDGARKAMLALFEQAGAQSELTREFRRRLMGLL